MKTREVFTAVVGIAHLALLCSAVHGEASALATVPDSFQMCRVGNLTNLSAYMRDMLVWPERPAEQHTPSAHATGVRLACDDTWRWINKIIVARYVPHRSQITMLALTNSVDGCDAIRCRYVRGGYCIQITSLSSAISVAVRGVGNETPATEHSPDRIVDFAKSVIAEIFNASEKIISNTCRKVTVREHGVTSNNSPDYIPETSEWWGWGRWFSDGTFLVFTTLKVYDAGIPRVCPPRDIHWFAAEQRRYEERHRNEEVVRQCEREEQHRAGKEQKSTTEAAN